MKGWYKINIILLLLVGTANAQTKKPVICDTTFTLCNKEVYLSYPSDLEGKYPVIMAIHGSGRESLSYDPRSEAHSDFYVHQRDLAVNNGFMFVVISNGSDTWGTDEGLRRLDSLYGFVRKRYNVNKKWVLWSTSAGGVLLARFVKENPSEVCKAIGTFPVYDLRYEFNHLKSAYNAWKDDTIFLDRDNPINYPIVFKNVPYLIFHGKDDTSVPVKMNSLRLMNDVNRLGGHVILYIVPGGHSTHNWNVYNDKIITNFLLNKYICR